MHHPYGCVRLVAMWGAWYSCPAATRAAWNSRTSGSTSLRSPIASSKTSSIEADTRTHSTGSNSAVRKGLVLYFRTEPDDRDHRRGNLEPIPKEKTTIPPAG